MEYILRFKNNLQNSLTTYEEIAYLCEQFSSYANGSQIIIDFSKVTFVAANLFAIIGCIFDSYIEEHNYKLGFYQINSDIKTIMRKNGFGKYFHWENYPDVYGTTIAFKKFNTNQIREFEKHTVINVLNASNMPSMSSALKNEIIGRFLEIFNNVIDHTKSKSVYVCGQFFPKKGSLYYTIVDKGETIEYNVNNYIQKKAKILTEPPLLWAMKPGNSTNENNSPGGLGLHLIIELIKLNKGEFILISGNECYEYTSKNEHYLKMEHSFPGTIVTTSFNVLDTHSYKLKTEVSQTIQL